MTQCAWCRKQGWDHDKIKEMCENSLYWFTRIVVTDWVSPDLHAPLSDWFHMKYEEGDRYFLILVPRGHLKTSMFTISYPCQRLAKDPSLRILIVMCSGEMAREKLNLIKSIIQSDVYKHFWGSIVPDPNQVTWTRDKLNVVRPREYEEPSITAVGAESKLTGRHYDIQILDDLVDGMASNSDQQMVNAIDFLTRTPGLWVRRSDALQIVVGTLWPGGFYEELLEDPDYTKITIGCYVDDRFRAFLAEMGLTTEAEDGDPVFTGHETKESLAISERRFKTKFDHQMLNIIVSDELRRFKRGDCERFYQWGDNQKRDVHVDGVYYPISLMYIQLCIDPASYASDKTDDTAITVTGWNREPPFACVLDYACERMTTKTAVERILGMAQEWDVDVIRPEHAGMQVIYKDFIYNEMVRRGIWYPIYDFKPGTRSKGQRIVDALQPFVASHQVWFRKDQFDLINALVNLIIVKGKIKGKSPNLVDSLSFHTEFWNANPPVNFDDIGEIPIVHDTDQMTREQEVRYGLRCSTRLRRITM